MSAVLTRICITLKGIWALYECSAWYFDQLSKCCHQPTWWWCTVVHSVVHLRCLVWIMFHRWYGRHGASPKGLRELSLRTWCKIPCFRAWVTVLNRLYPLLLFECAEKSLLMYQHWGLILLLQHFCWHDKYKTFLKRFHFSYWLLVPHLAIRRPVLWQYTSVTGKVV